MSLVPYKSGSSSNRFHGLGLSPTTTGTYLDGTGGLYPQWFHAVGVTGCYWGNPCGIPADNNNIAAQSSSLYIWNPNSGMKV